MFESLLSGLRSIRVSFITGGVIVISVYVLFYDTMFEEMTVRPFVLKLFELSNMIPIIFITTISLIIGSLYTTFLEGVVDGLHRKHVNTIINPTKNNLKDIILNSLQPYSPSAKKRLKIEASRFYKEYSQKVDNDSNNEDLENKFIRDVLIETLWMEGKIAGTLLEQPYDRIRSEGEIRVAGGLLLPLACFTMSYILFANNFQIFLSLTFGLILSIAIVNYGLYYYKKANSFLAHHISDGKVLSPSMETLKRTSAENKQMTKELDIKGKITVEQ